MNLHPASSLAAHSAIERWLYPLENLSLECDGMSRVIAALFNRASIQYTVFMGMLVDTSLPATDPNAKVLHCWITLSDGAIVDYRARMWFGADAPHGVFHPSEFSRFKYSKPVPQGNFSLPINLLSAMAETDLSAFPNPPIEAQFQYESVSKVQQRFTMH
ncbi:hypothetical protein [Pseudomonas sp. UMAB-40]|uniref:hypothetical protein n=1 Tax=Pseudomonas sp. UMAB-40 TaxID=1365407 RepID=UPI001C5793CD|nr:hypothetical protein [Pseudomonas sp. UMAB-40]